MYVKNICTVPERTNFFEISNTLQKTPCYAGTLHITHILHKYFTILKVLVNLFQVTFMFTLGYTWPLYASVLILGTGIYSCQFNLKLIFGHFVPDLCTGTMHVLYVNLSRVYDADTKKRLFTGDPPPVVRSLYFPVSFCKGLYCR